MKKEENEFTRRLPAENTKTVEQIQREMDEPFEVTPHHSSDVEEAAKALFNAGVRCGQTNDHHPQDPNYGEYEDRAFMDVYQSGGVGKLAEILTLCDKLPKEANYFGTVDRIKQLLK